MSDIKPNKSLGQHWLHDLVTLDSICDSADVKPGDIVLEIGPGLGTLTRRLLERGARVMAVELDEQLAHNLPLALEDCPLKANLTVVNEDILKYDLTSLPLGYKVVANIPYYLTSNLIRVLCESSNPFSTAVLLIQKEVADRVVAGPGQMSLLSVTTQFYCDASLGTFVSAKLFTPPPKVDSQVLVLRFRQKPLFSGVNTKDFFRLVKAGFSQKRKTLLNSLSGGMAMTKDDVRKILEGAGMSPDRRAQSLSLEEWFDVYLSWTSTENIA